MHEKRHFAAPGNYLKKGRIPQLNSLKEQLKQAFHDGSWQGRRACLAMDNRVCYMRAITMPQLKERELKQAMLFEARKLFPFNEGEAVVSFMPIDSSPGRTPAAFKYLLAAVSKETANLYTSLASAAGLIPVSLEAPATAWLRYMASYPAQVNPENHGPQLVLDCGYNSTLLILTLKRRYCFHRVIHPGIRHFIQAAGAAGNGAVSEPLRLVYSEGTLAEKGLLPVAAKLARSIRDSLGYWSELGGHDQGYRLNHAALLIGGGGALIPGLAAYLRRELELETVLNNPLAKPGGTSSGNEPGPGSKPEGMLFSSAYGLAIRGWLK